MARLKIPIIVSVIGEGCSGGAIGIGVGDRIGMLEHSYYSVISPEGCASILWKDASMKAEAAGALKLLAEDLIEYGAIDAIVKEPLGGAHHDKEKTAATLQEFIMSSYRELKRLSMKQLLEQRYEKFRKMGAFEE